MGARPWVGLLVTRVQGTALAWCRERGVATRTTGNGRQDQAGIPPQPAGWRGLNRTAEEFGIVLNEEVFAEFEGEPALVVDRLDVATSEQPLLVGDDGPSA